MKFGSDSSGSANHRHSIFCVRTSLNFSSPKGTSRKWNGSVHVCCVSVIHWSRLTFFDNFPLSLLFHPKNDGLLSHNSQRSNVVVTHSDNGNGTNKQRDTFVPKRNKPRSNYHTFHTIGNTTTRQQEEHEVFNKVMVERAPYITN